MASPQQVLVTGMGAVTPLGVGVSATWAALLRGDDAVGPLDLFDLGGMACTRAGQIRAFAPPACIVSAGGHDRASAFAAAACLEALGPLADSGPAARSARETTGLVAATNFGSLDHGETAWLTAPSAAAVRDLSAGSTADLLSAALDLGGPRTTVTLSCAAGAAALAYAAGSIARGRSSRVLVVGYDAISRFAWSGLCALRTMSRDWVRPFDRNRSGTIFSEGAAAILLESQAACAARGGTPLATLPGWATGNNGHHMTAPAPRGAGSAQVMRQALRRAGIEPDAIDHVNAHGTGTKPNDSTEAQAIADVFGSRAASIPVTSIKSSIGHMLGAAGTIEAIASVLSLREGIVPPTTHFETPDPECPVDLVANRPRPATLRYVLSNSAGIGGCNAALVLGVAA
jgi:3-oxoacyl-(acyl-carrier-protein) synthase